MGRTGGRFRGAVLRCVVFCAANDAGLLHLARRAGLRPAPTFALETMSGLRVNGDLVRCRVSSFAVLFAFALILAVGFLAAGPSLHAAKQPPAHPIDLNTATALQLEQLPGIGPSRASAIIAFREKSGPFKRIEDLLAVRGITKQRLEKIRPYVKITPPKSKSGTAH